MFHFCVLCAICYAGRHAEDFFALKNPTASAGFEPANLGTKGQHATPRPPKPINEAYTENKHREGSNVEIDKEADKTKESALQGEDNSGKNS